MAHLVFGPISRIRDRGIRDGGSWGVPGWEVLSGWGDWSAGRLLR